MKKIPMRRCLGCNVSKPKKELLRIVKGVDGEVCIDKTGKANGRGAYICKNKECLSKALKTKRIERSLEMSIPEAVIEEMMNDVDS